MRIARSALAALASVRKGGPLSHPVRATLTFLQFLLPILPSRLVDLRERARRSQSRPVIVWSDAAWEESSATGGLGFVVWFPPGHPGASPRKGRFRYAARKGVTADDFPFFSRSHHLIQQLELLAAAAVYTSFPSEFFAGQQVLHFIDNVGALSGLIRGVARAVDCLSIVRAFHLTNLGLKADVWFNYVASKANVADLPSRWALSEMQRILRSFSPSFSLTADSVDLATPECLQSIPEMWDVIQARLQAPDHPPSRAPRPRASHKKRSRPSSSSL